MFKSFHEKKSFVNLFRFISNQRQQLPISVLTKKMDKKLFSGSTISYKWVQWTYHGLYAVS